MELSSSYSCVPNFDLVLVICLPYSSYAILVLCPYGYSHAKVLLCYGYSLYVFHMQSMFRLVDLCYGISLVFNHDCSNLTCHSEGVEYLEGLEYMFTNVNMVLGLHRLHQMQVYPMVDRGWR